MADLIARAYESVDSWRALGHARHVSPLALFVRRPELPRVYDANFVARVRAESSAEIEQLLAEVERRFGGLGHRLVFWDPGMPAPFEARLVLEGFEAECEVVQVLEGPLAERGPAVDIRPVQSDADWKSLEVLAFEDHREEAQKGFHAEWERSLTSEIVAAKRAKAPAVQYFLARYDDVDCAFFSAWPGENGVGTIEDLFTSQPFRRRGIGTALIAHCVDDARARGARSVLISARSNDTPALMYRRLGFRPLCVQRSYLKRCPGEEPSEDLET